MWIWSERTYRPTSKKPHGKNPQAIKFLIFSISIFSVLAFWPPFDHYCAVALRNAGKACCDNQQQAFSCFGCSWVESTKFTFQRQSILPCRSSPTRKARGSNPPGRTKSSTLWGAALFVLHGFYGAVKGRIRTARAPRFASRGAETPRWELSVFRCLHDEPVPPATRQTPAGPPRCSNRQGWPGRMPAPDGQWLHRDKGKCLWTFPFCSNARSFGHLWTAYHVPDFRFAHCNVRRKNL